MQINIGIPENQRKDIADGLSKLLADTYTLYLKTNNFHRNVTGPMFKTLHVMFEEQYTELSLAIDKIAERIRALGFFVPATYAQFSQLTSIKEQIEVPNANSMITLLLDGHECVIRTARGMYPKADEANDEATVDILTERMEVHEKAAWMLRSMLEG